jgi:ABC-type branched-subunit amino acid transport system ATPase component
MALKLADFGYAFQRGRVVVSGSGPEMLRDMRFQEAYFGSGDPARSLS